MNVFSFFVIYRLNLNCNAKLTAERHIIDTKFWNNAIPTQTFCLKFLEKNKELLKINLVFRASLLAECFLLKLNRPWLCPSNLAISTKTWRKTPIDNPAGTQRPEDVPLWSYFGCNVPDHNRSKIGRLRFLTYFGSAVYGMHLASENIEKFP